MHKFHVGQKVVCVFDGELPSPFGYQNHTGLNGLVEGQIYTIRWVGEVKYPVVTYLGIQVEEIKRDCWAHIDPKTQNEARIRGTIPFNEDTPYAAERFKPLIETDISIFTAMLNTIPQFEDA